MNEATPVLDRPDRAHNVQPGLSELQFENTFVRELPGDPVLDNVPRQVRHASYTRVDPTPVRAPQLLAWAHAVGDMLGVARPGSSTGLEVQVLGGNTVLA